MIDFTIVPQRPEDEALIDPLLDITFGADRHARPSYRFRDGIAPVPALCFSAVNATGDFMATLRFWPVVVEGETAILLGPLAVQPTLQGRGIGRALVKHGLEAAQEQGFRLCFVVGEQRYYAPYGFVPAQDKGYAMPVAVDPDRFQVMSLNGEAFDALPCGDLAPLESSPAA